MKKDPAVFLGHLLDSIELSRAIPGERPSWI